MTRSTSSIEVTPSATSLRPSSRKGVIPPLSAALAERYPALRPHFIDGAGLALHKWLLAGELDLAILYADRGLGPVIATPLLEESLVLVGPPGSKIDGRRPSRDLVSSLPLILPSRPNRHRLLVDEIAAPGEANVVVEVEANAAIMAMIAAGQGYTVTTYSGAASEIASGRAAAFPLHSPQVSRTLVVARLAERQLTTATAAVEVELHTLIHVLAGQLRWRPLMPLPGKENSRITAGRNKIKLGRKRFASVGSRER